MPGEQRRGLCARQHTHVCTHGRTHTTVHARAHGHTHTVHACVRTCSCTHVCKVHMCMHVYACAHTCIFACLYVWSLTSRPLTRQPSPRGKAALGIWPQTLTSLPGGSWGGGRDKKGSASPGAESGHLQQEGIVPEEEKRSRR